MPIYEYACDACGLEFESLVRRGDAPSCPECDCTALRRLVSTPALKSEATHAQAMRAAKRRDAGASRDRMHERLRYEESHDRHG